MEESKIYKSQKCNWASLEGNLSSRKEERSVLAKAKINHDIVTHISILLEKRPCTIIEVKVVDGIVICGDKKFSVKLLKTVRGLTMFRNQFNKLKDKSFNKHKGGFKKGQKKKKWYYHLKIDVQYVEKN